MEIKLRKIGNSRGIILNKRILKDVNITDRIQLTVKDSQIIIEPVNENPRKDWEKQLLAANSLDDKELFFEDIENDFDKNEWTW